MDNNKLGPMRSSEVVSRMRQRVINARLQVLKDEVLSCLAMTGVPDTGKVMDSVYHLRAILALDPVTDSGDVVRTYLEFYNAYDLVASRDSDALYNIIFNFIHHISFTYAEHPYPVTPIGSE